MRLVDANVLLYAVNESARHHEEARRWLDGALSGAETVGLPWVSLLAFVRLSTKPALFPSPLPVAAALDRVRSWTTQPTSVIPEPTERHLDVLTGLLTDVGTAGNLTSDAHLAALALEHRGEVVTYDNDFGRFPGVRWRRPAAPGPA